MGLSRAAIVYCCLILQSCCRAFQVSYRSFKDVDGLLLQGGVSSPSESSLWLTQPGRNGTTGRVLYQRPLPFKPSNASSLLASFNTSFSFQIVVPDDVEPSLPGDRAADGLAFFIAPSSELLPESTGMQLGLAQGLWAAQSDRHLFAVEFDTLKNAQLNDTSDNHIGIDINGLEMILLN
ncbi:hypothetical protein GOP47_0000296 [Adiantum capillus-veneris]|uniref:Legume lectin domain-containing protein n=1 Tax=Adiantum capillus-veneris TaxID=13818 RepID=A0A9D4ZSR2_ADICA|nr:hypothetical protein GOP47_0000296 [Adiantum capillus-veneris]